MNKAMRYQVIFLLLIGASGLNVRRDERQEDDDDDSINFSSDQERLLHIYNPNYVGGIPTYKTHTNRLDHVCHDELQQCAYEVTGIYQVRNFFAAFSGNGIDKYCRNIHEAILCAKEVLKSDRCAASTFYGRPGVFAELKKIEQLFEFACLQNLPAIKRNIDCLLEVKNGPFGGRCILLSGFSSDPCGKTDVFNTCVDEIFSESRFHCQPEAAELTKNFVARFVQIYRSCPVVREPILGCPDIEASDDQLVDYLGEDAMVRCKNTLETWYLTCIGDQWIGERGNCTAQRGRVSKI